MFATILVVSIIALLATLIGRVILKISNPGGFLGGFLVSYLFCALGQQIIPCEEWDRFLGNFCLLPALLTVWAPWYWWWHERGLLSHKTEPELCESLVRISLDSSRSRIIAEPENVCLFLKSSLVWKIDSDVQDDNPQVEIEFERGVKGSVPFSQPGFQNDPGCPAIRSGAALKSGNWKYTIRWKPSQGEELPPLDPRVMIR